MFQPPQGRCQLSQKQSFPGSDIRVFGQVNGQDVLRIVLRSETGLCAHVLTWGAVLQDLRVPLASGACISTTLGFETFDPYPQHSPYFGATVGRYANRIAGGRYEMNGRSHWLDRNEAGRTTLHGGAGGFSQRLWQIIAADAASVTLGLTSEDGDQGFAGRVEVRCRYSVGPGYRMRVEYRAETDAPTPLNLTQHSYFNLDGSDDLRHHHLQVYADSYTPTDADNIPTGAILGVAGTAFDFRSPRKVMGSEIALDHNFVLAAAEAGRLRPAARLMSDASGLVLTISTTKPGVQVYDGHKVDVQPKGLAGRSYGAFAGLCLEPQFFPNSPNCPAFPSSILYPQETYRHLTFYSFDDGALADM